jgi:hypothetical protein
MKIYRLLVNRMTPVCLILIASTINIAAGPIHKESEVAHSLSVMDDTSFTLISINGQIVLSSKKGPAFFALQNIESMNSANQISQLTYRWNRKYNAIVNFQNNFFMLSKQEGIVYTAEGLGGVEKPFCNLDQSLYGSTERSGEKTGELCPDALAYDGRELFVVVEQGYSSRIIGVEPLTSATRHICYTQGIPAGLFFSNDTLWYLGNGRSNDVKPHILGIPIRADRSEKADLPLDVTVPFRGLASGIVSKDGFLYSFNKADNKVYKLHVK